MNSWPKRALKYMLPAWFVFVYLLASAGLRLPGPYNGVVIFDRWDGCHLYSGQRLMYISGKLKDGLRGFAGMFVLVDALTVDQPINPGDGRIDKLGLGELDREQAAGVPTDNLTIVAKPEIGTDGRLVVQAKLTNRGQQARLIHLDQLAVTLFARIPSAVEWRVSDGPSEAVLSTSVRLLYSNSKEGTRRTDSEAGDHHSYAVSMLSPERPTKGPLLMAGESYKIRVAYDLPKGEYDFIAGYGGGIHASRLVVSNMIAVDVDAAGRVLLPQIPGRE